MSVATKASIPRAVTVCVDPECRYEVACDATFKGWAFVAAALRKHYQQEHGRMTAFHNEAIDRPGGTA